MSTPVGAVAVTCRHDSCPLQCLVGALQPASTMARAAISSGILVMRHRLDGAGLGAHLSAVMVRTMTSDRFRAAAPRLKVCLV